jgi:pilus assembly protein CpaE
VIYRVSIDAFALTPAVAEVLKAVRDDRAFAKSRVNVLPGGLEAAARHYADAPTPQVVIVEEEDGDATLMARLEQLAEVCEPGTRVVVIGARNDIALYRQLLSQGISDYLVRPVTARQVAAAIAAIFEDPAAAARGKMLAFWGVRGGVGSSTLAQNTAWAMGRALGEPVVYLDLDLAFGTSVLAFNLDAKQSVVDALANPERLDQVLMERFLVGYDDCLEVLPSPGDPRLTAEVGIDGLDKLLDLAARMGPVVVADLPHQWAAWTEHLLLEADEVVLVATPDLFCLRDAKTMLETLASRRGEAAAPRLVLNKFDAAKRTQLSPKDFEETLNLAPTLTLPFDPVLFGTAANNGQMLGEAAKTHKVVDQVNAFAAQLLGRSPAAGKKRGGSKPSRKSLLAWLKK